MKKAKNPLGLTDEEMAQARLESPDVDECARIAEAGFKSPYTGLSVKVMATSLRALRMIAKGAGKSLDELTIDDIIARSKADELLPRR